MSDVTERTVTEPAMQDDPKHRLRELLPAVFRRLPELDAFLAPFDELLFGTPEGREDPESGVGEIQAAERRPSLSERIDGIPSLLDPDETPAEFLAWLSQWAAVSLYPEARDGRRLIAEVIPLYRERGTRAYVERLLELYTGGRATVEEDDLPGMALGVRGQARVGIDTRLGEDPFRFTVRIEFAGIPPSRAAQRRVVALARAVIDLAKPAFSYYRLSHNLPDDEGGLIVSIRSTVGETTLLQPR